MSILQETKLNIGKFLKSDKALYLYLLLIAFAVIFYSTFNPFNFREMHIDTSNYITVSKGFINGLLPYRDLVDNKGPLMYLLNVPGLLLGGLTGVWITELVLMFISVLFAYKTALFFTDKYKALLGTAFSFVILLAFFLINGGTEEYSLPFLTISFYIFTKYYFSKDKQEGVTFLELAAFGACFACAINIRLNMFPLWLGFCLVIFIKTILKRCLLMLCKYIFGFLLGVVIVSLPLYLFLKLNGIFNEFLAQVIFAGTTRGFSGSNINHTVRTFYGIINNTYSVVPLFFGFYFTIKNFKQKDFFYYLGYTLSYILTVMFLAIPPVVIARINLVLIPFFIPVIIYLTGIVFSSFSDKKFIKTIVLFFIFFAFSNEGFGKYFWILPKIFTENYKELISYTGNMINENTNPGDKIISLGGNGRIYPFTKRLPASKYFYQGSGLNEIPNAREEFQNDILSYKPVMIAVYTGPDDIEEYVEDWHGQIFEMMKSEYYLFSRNFHFNLYKRNN